MGTARELAKVHSICLDCKFVGSCKDMRSRAQPITQCDNFVSYKDSAEVMGLCFNCAHRDTCTFPRQEGGVWHCEEYE